jgi:hypothetical protein
MRETAEMFRQAGRRPDGFTVSRRVSPCRADVARAGSNSSLKGPSGTPAGTAVVADVYAPCYDANLKRWTERAGQFPLRPYRTRRPASGERKRAVKTFAYSPLSSGSAGSPLHEPRSQIGLDDSTRSQPGRHFCPAADAGEFNQPSRVRPQARVAPAVFPVGFSWWMAQSAVVRWETRLTFGKGVIEADSSMPRAFRTLLRAPDLDLAERCAGGRMRGRRQPCGPELLDSARAFYPSQR